MDQEDQRDHNTLWLTRTGSYILLMYSDSYLATSIARLVDDSCVLIPDSVVYKDLCIGSRVYERT